MSFPGGDEKIEITSTTSWEKEKLIRRSKFESEIRIGTERHTIQYEETEIYSLSEDRNSLTIQTNAQGHTPFSMSPIASSGKMIFRRKN